MKDVSLKQLRYFQAVMENGHFGRAAEACAISQPALSMRIKELEQSLGTVLFERSARHVRPTRFGEAFAARVRDVLLAVDELGEFARASRDRLAGRLHLGIIPTIAPYLLPALVAELGRSHPEIDLDIHETITSRLIAELLDGRLDAAIVALPVGEATLTEVELFSEPFVLVRPAAEADLPAPERDDLHHRRVLLLDEGHCFRDQALAFCGLPAAQNTSSGLAGSSLSTLVQMVGAGLGVTLIPDMAIDVEARWPSVCVTRLTDPQPVRAVGMIWRKTSPLAEQFAEIGDVVRRAAAAKGLSEPDLASE
ncbi:LysR substrate-binding domain-containing protein [Aestuariibius sp. 2305UL40-4]|uniref:LysR substrate-binding domain-containing protein n=1 Tax=Aestuariibius violaceus TaxID=3234132 RepID=UPI00345E807D